MEVRLHLLKAERNKKLLSNFLIEIIKECPDWVSVVAFYTALHFVEAFLKKEHGLDFEHHEERHSFMSVHLPEIFDAYYRLYDLGFSARYKSINDAPTYDDADSAVKYDLADVEKFVMERL
jgi:hypothetical protein